MCGQAVAESECAAHTTTCPLPKRFTGERFLKVEDKPKEDVVVVLPVEAPKEKPEEKPKEKPKEKPEEKPEETHKEETHKEEPEDAGANPFEIEQPFECVPVEFEVNPFEEDLTAVALPEEKEEEEVKETQKKAVVNPFGTEEALQIEAKEEEKPATVLVKSANPFDDMSSDDEAGNPFDAPKPAVAAQSSNPFDAPSDEDDEEAGNPFDTPSKEEGGNPFDAPSDEEGGNPFDAPAVAPSQSTNPFDAPSDEEGGNPFDEAPQKTALRAQSVVQETTNPFDAIQVEEKAVTAFSNVELKPEPKPASPFDEEKPEPPADQLKRLQLEEEKRVQEMLMREEEKRREEQERAAEEERKKKEEERLVAQRREFEAAEMGEWREARVRDRTPVL